MENIKDLLIVEMSSNTLSVNESADSKDYVLEGIFGEIDVKNKNQRIYTESEYVPQIEALQQKIKSGKLLGELDHPSQFDVSLKNVSHVIEDLYYDQDNKQVKGRIRLLDTDAGRQAKALVDAGVPLQISSRAAGAVESNGKVKIKQLFTYDLVADPGFANAELKRVNESFGYDSEGGLFIYEINKEQENNTTTQIIENQEMADFVKADDFNKYTEYLANEIKSLKEAIETTNQPVENEVSEADLNAVREHNDHIVENFNNLSEYVKYLAEKLDQSIQYSEHVAEKADQGIQYTEEVAEKVDQSIQYSEHLAEGMEKVKEYANYLAESHNENTTSAEKLVEYVDYLKTNLQSVTEYAEYIAESINENLVVEAEEGEGAAKDMEEIEKKDSEVGDNSEEGDVADDVATLPAEELEADTTEVNSEEDKKTTDTSSELEADLEGSADDAGKEVVESEEAEEVEESGEEAEEVEESDEEAEEVEESDEEAEEVEESTTDAYKNEISSKLSSLVEAATKKENENPSFFKIVSSRIQEKYNSLNEDAKTEVRRAVSKRGFMTESQIESIMESSTLIVENRNAEPFFIAAMPVEYKEAWENLSESKKNQISAQSKYHRLETEYQVRNFWQTRDLREAAPVMEKLEMVKEAKEVENKGLGYDVAGYAEQFKKRFNK